MNRRGFLRSLLASTATIVVAPACVLGELPPLPGDPHRTYFDMGRNHNRDDLLGSEWTIWCRWLDLSANTPVLIGAVYTWSRHESY